MELVTPNFGLLVWTAVAFILVWVILGRTAFGPIAKALEARSNSIEEALKSADRAKEEMKKLQSDNEALLREARAERDQMLKEAKAVADKMVADAEGRAKEEADKIIKSAQEAIQAEKNAAMADVRTQVATIALDVAEKVLRKELADKSAQQSLVDEYLDSMKLN